MTQVDTFLKFLHKLNIIIINIIIITFSSFMIEFTRFKWMTYQVFIDSQRFETPW